MKLQINDFQGQINEYNEEVAKLDNKLTGKLEKLKW